MFIKLMSHFLFILFFKQGESGKKIFMKDEGWRIKDEGWRMKDEGWWMIKDKG